MSDNYMVVATSRDGRVYTVTFSDYLQAYRYGEVLRDIMDTDAHMFRWDDDLCEFVKDRIFKAHNKEVI